MTNTNSRSWRIQIIIFFLLPIVAFLQVATIGLWQGLPFGLIPSALLGLFSIGLSKWTKKPWLRHVPAITIAALGVSGMLYLSFGGSFAPDIFEADMTYGMISFLLLIVGIHIRGWVMFLEWKFHWD